jgi:hypothetical protein
MRTSRRFRSGTVQTTPVRFGAPSGRINTLIQPAEKATGETRVALIEKAYELVRNVCEVKRGAEAEISIRCWTTGRAQSSQAVWSK